MAASNGAPRLSVLVPVWNGGRFLRTALDSAVRETDEHDEILVSDDASTDESAEILREFNGRLRVYRNTTRAGIARNHNLLLRRARGKYVAFLHQDDELTPESLRLRSDVLDSNDALDLVTGDSLFVDGSGSLLGPPQTPRLPAPSDFQGADPASANYLRLRALVQVLRLNLFQVGSVMMRRTLTDRVGDFYEPLTLTLDYDYWLRSLLFSPVGHLPSPVLRFRVHKDQASQVYRENPALAAREMSLAIAHARREARRFGVRLPFPIAAEWNAMSLVRSTLAGLPPSLYRGIPAPISRTWVNFFGM